MSIKALKTLVESSKATVMVAVLVVLGLLLYLGRIDAQQFLDTLKIIIPGWMVAHAGERGVVALANGKQDTKALVLDRLMEMVEDASEEDEDEELPIEIDADKQDDEGEAKAPQKESEQGEDE